MDPHTINADPHHWTVLGSGEGMDDMRVKFLTKRRHHEELEEFQVIIDINGTICPGRSDSFYTVNNYIKVVTTYVLMKHYVRQCGL